MAAEGRCKALDARADGYVRSEAAVSALLHPLTSYQDAVGDSWVVLLAGSAVHQGGRSSTLTAPNGPSQQAVIRAALDEAGWTPGSIAKLAMHGTGTQLGDPIEVGAAAAVLVEGHNTRRVQQPLALSGSKSWVGHSEPASGMVGFAHAALALGGGLSLGISHLRHLNPYVTNATKVMGEHAMHTTLGASVQPCPSRHPLLSACGRRAKAQVVAAKNHCGFSAARQQWGDGMRAVGVCIPGHQRARAAAATAADNAVQRPPKHVSPNSDIVAAHDAVGWPPCALHAAVAAQQRSWEPKVYRPHGVLAGLHAASDMVLGPPRCWPGAVPRRRLL